MSGESRLAFHAVPRIIKTGQDNEPPDALKWTEQTTQQECESKCCKNDFKATSVTDISEQNWSPFAQYLSNTRINVNVRQVHSLGNTVENQFGSK